MKLLGKTLENTFIQIDKPILINYLIQSTYTVTV